MAGPLGCVLPWAACFEGHRSQDSGLAADGPPPISASIVKVYCPCDRQTPSKSLEIAPDGDFILSGHDARILGRARISDREREDTWRLWRAASPLPPPPACDPPPPGVPFARLVLMTAGSKATYDVRPECATPPPLLELSSWIGALYGLHFDELTRTPSPVPLEGATLPAAIDLARRDLATRLRIGADRVAVAGLEERLWPDTCLGLPSPELCAPGELPGYRVVFEVLGQAYAYHTDEATTFRSAEVGARARSGDHGLVFFWFPPKTRMEDSHAE